MFNPKSMITDQTGRHEVMLSINHNQDKICDKRNSKTFFASSEIKKPYLSSYSVLLVLKSGELIANLTRFENFVMVMARGGGATSHTTSLNEIQMMFSNLAKQSARLLPGDMCTDHAHYVKNHRSTVFRKNKSMAVEGGTVSHYYILVIRKFIDFMSLFRHSVWFCFSVKQFPLQSLECATYSSV